MNTEELNTLQKIHKAGKKEFLEKGFKSASLRNIVKEAGVTTGAFYGYYKSKEDLFDAIVGEAADIFMEQYRSAQDAFAKLPAEEQPENMGKISGACMEWMVSHIYAYKDEFKLLICCAEGTKYENMIHEMVEIETKATHDFMDVLRSLGFEVKEIDPQLEHIIISGMFTGFFEMIVHDMPQERAMEYVKELQAFHTAGWSEIMGLKVN